MNRKGNRRSNRKETQPKPKTRNPNPTQNPFPAGPSLPFPQPCGPATPARPDLSSSPRKCTCIFPGPISRDARPRTRTRSAQGRSGQRSPVSHSPSLPRSTRSRHLPSLPSRTHTSGSSPSPHRAHTTETPRSPPGISPRLSRGTHAQKPGAPFNRARPHPPGTLNPSPAPPHPSPPLAAPQLCQGPVTLLRTSNPRLRHARARISTRSHTRR